MGANDPNTAVAIRVIRSFRVIRQFLLWSRHGSPPRRSPCRGSSRPGYCESTALTTALGVRLRDEIRNIQALMEQQSYVTDRGIATAVYLATLNKPLLV